MNLLFCTTSEVSKQKGGTERITATISDELRKRGYHCYSAYKNNISNDFVKTQFDGAVNVLQHSLSDFIISHDINVIIVQKMTRDVAKLRCFIDKLHVNCRIFTVLHFNPGYEELAMTIGSAYDALKSHSNNIVEYCINIVRVVSYPVYKLYYPLRNKELYRTVYKYSDKVVLLSHSFINEYADYCGLGEKSKFVVIPNALSYDEFLRVDELKSKKKQVLVVSRLAETQKRISLVIRIWGMVERNLKLSEWSLKIVGAGDSEKDYRELVSHLRLKRVEFCGRQEPKKYYEESSIFMMTSSFEGWGLTLTEAQQFGCVPIAFDTFSALRDIINDGYNGYAVPDNDLNLYAHKLIWLMSANDNSWQRMAEDAIVSSKRYNIRNVVDMWESCFRN